MTEEGRRPSRVQKWSRRNALVALCYGLRRGWYNRLGVSTDMIPFIDYDATTPECRREYRRFVLSLSSQFPVIEITTDRGFHLIVLHTTLPYRVIAGYLESFYTTERLDVPPLEEYERLRSMRSRDARARELSRLPATWRRIFERILAGIDPPHILHLAPREIRMWATALRQQAHMNTNWFEGWYEWFKEVYRYWYEKGCVDKLHVDISIDRGYTTLRISGKENKAYDLRYTGLYYKRRVYRIPMEELFNMIEKFGMSYPDIEKEVLEARKYLKPPARPDTWVYVARQLKEGIIPKLYTGERRRRWRAR